jgi:hypothetical protein
MNAAEYRKAVAIARRACHGLYLSPQDWEEVEQDAAVEAWRTGSVTRIWWAARGGARRARRSRRVCQPVIIPLSQDVVSEERVDADSTISRRRSAGLSRLRSPALQD